jgi:hypothetical protein
MTRSFFTKSKSFIKVLTILAVFLAAVQNSFAQNSLLPDQSLNLNGTNIQANGTDLVQPQSPDIEITGDGGFTNSGNGQNSDVNLGGTVITNPTTNAPIIQTQPTDTLPTNPNPNGTQYNPNDYYNAATNPNQTNTITVNGLVVSSDQQKAATAANVKANQTQLAYDAAEAAYADAVAAYRRNPTEENQQKALAAQAALEKAGEENEKAWKDAEVANSAATGAPRDTACTVFGGWNGFKIDLKCLIATLIQWILLLFSALVYLAGGLLDVVFTYTITNLGANFAGIAPAVETCWKVVRDLINITFIFGLLWCAVNTILDRGDYKKTLATIILGALLVNFSLFFTKLIIDVSNNFAVSIYSAIDMKGQSSLASAFIGNLGLDKINDPNTLSALQGDGVYTKLLFSGLLGVILYAIAAFVFLIISLLLVVRFVMFIILMIESPIAIGGGAFPKVQEISKDWWKNLCDQALFAPIFFMFLWIIMKFVGGGILTGDVAAVSGNLGAQITNGAQLDGNNTGVMKLILKFAIIMALLILALTEAKKMASSGAGAAVGFISKHLNGGTLAKWTANQTAGRTMSRVANSRAGSFIANNRITSALGGRQMMRLVDKAGSGFDKLKAADTKDEAKWAGREAGFVNKNEKRRKATDNERNTVIAGKTNDEHERNKSVAEEQQLHLNTQLGTADAQRAVNEAETKDIDGKLAESRGQLAGLASVESDLTKALSEHESLQKEHEKLQQEADKVKADPRSTPGNIREVNERLEAAKQRASTAQTKVDGLQAKKQSKDTLTANVNGLEKRKAEVASHNDKLMQNKAAINGALGKIADDLKKSEENLNGALSKVAGYDANNHEASKTRIVGAASGLVAKGGKYQNHKDSSAEQFKNNYLVEEEKSAQQGTAAQTRLARLNEIVSKQREKDQKDVMKAFAAWQKKQGEGGGEKSKAVGAPKS